MMKPWRKAVLDHCSDCVNAIMRLSDSVPEYWVMSKQWWREIKLSVKDSDGAIITWDIGMGESALMGYPVKTSEDYGIPELWFIQNGVLFTAQSRHKIGTRW
jgi:hypothetical protein